MKHPKTISTILPIICLLPALLLWGLPIHAEVSAKLSHSTTTLDEPVRLKLLIMDESDASPDLSVLTEDFDILGRSQQQSTSIVNGRKSTTLGLILVLLPKKSGTLTVPAIPVGRERTDPLTLEVLPGRSPPPPAVIQQPFFPPYLESIPQPAAPLSTVQPVFEGESVEPCSNWLAWLFGAGWLTTLVGCWLSLRGKKRPAPIPIPPQQREIEETPEDELQVILNALDTAYQNSDRETAREGWLNWGRYRWPNNPPGNLNRLAERSPQTVAQAVISLDRAFYSPENQQEWLKFKPAALLGQTAKERS
ncbi:MAG: BatD family protein [Pseudomonadota bacterium]